MLFLPSLIFLIEIQKRKNGKSEINGEKKGELPPLSEIDKVVMVSNSKIARFYIYIIQFLGINQ